MMLNIFKKKGAADNSAKGGVMFLKRVLKGLCFWMFIMMVLGIGINTAFAARSTGMDATEKMAYDYKLNCPIWPWASIQGYTNTTFVLSEAQYNAGYTGRSYINIEADDNYNKYVYKEVEVTEGTNYARTGTVKLSGYRKECTSSHTSMLKINGKTYTYNEHLKE